MCSSDLAAPRPRTRRRGSSELLGEKGQEFLLLARWKVFHGVFDFGERAHGRKMPERRAIGNRSIILRNADSKGCALSRGRVHAPPHWLQAVPPLTTKLSFPAQKTTLQSPQLRNERKMPDIGNEGHNLDTLRMPKSVICAKTTGRLICSSC